MRARLLERETEIAAVSRLASDALSATGALNVRLAHARASELDRSYSSGSPET